MSVRRLSGRVSNERERRGANWPTPAAAPVCFGPPPGSAVARPQVFVGLQLLVFFGHDKARFTYSLSLP